MTFQRARTDEQREARRRQILQTAWEMLTEMPVAKLSLNELSRRAGLAKPNVVRYFESREAILLELLNAELTDWVDGLKEAPLPQGTARERGDALAAALAASIAARPVLCDLASAQAAVLERNISTDVALRHKHAANAAAADLTALVRRALPELAAEDAYDVVVVTLVHASALWPHSQPSEAVRAAYAADPSLAGFRLDFTQALGHAIELVISGLVARLGED
ncbi:TetR family transcriptional regulator [Glycomyces scopariae]